MVIRELNRLSTAIRDYNGQLAKWKSSGYKGRVPDDLLVTIDAIYTESEAFLLRKKAYNED